MFHDVKCTSLVVKRTSHDVEYTFRDAKHKMHGVIGTFSPLGGNLFIPTCWKMSLGVAGIARFNFREIVLYFVNLFCISPT